jgi:hypothetical protein
VNDPDLQSPQRPKTPRTFSRTLILALPLHVLAAILIVGGSAAFYGTSLSGHGTWATVGGWSLTALYVVIALIGGTVAGILDAAQQTVERLELLLREWLHTLPRMGTAAAPVGRTIPTIRQEYETVLDQFVTQAGAQFRLPRWLEKLIRSVLRGVVVDRFIASCTERGLTLVAPQEFRNWLLAEGVSLGFMLVHDQLSWWRYLVLGLLGLLVAIALALALFTV